MSRGPRWSARDNEQPLFGRDDLVTSVIDALGVAPVVTLVGDGGFGKSRVARRVVAELSTAGQRALLIDLAEPGEAPDLAATRASAVESSAVGGVLVLLDNIVEPPAWLGDFVAGVRPSPNVRVLATSLNALRVRGERVITVGPISDHAAGQLFEHAASSESRRCAPAPCNTADITRICSLLEGWPLAIELAARRTRVQSVGEVLLALENDRLISVLDDPALEERTAVRELLTATATSMPDDERALANRLTGYADWLTLAEIADVAPVPSRTLDVVTSLVERHVVEMDDGDTTTLFRLRRPYRELIEEQLAALPAEASTQLVQVASLRRFARASIDGLLAGATAGGDTSPWYSAIGRRRRDLRAASLALLAEDAEGAAELTLALSMHAAERGDLSDDDGMLDKVLGAVIADREVSPALELMLRGFQLRRRVEAVDPMTDTGQLAADLQAAVSDASELGDPRVTLTLLGESVRSARTIGHFGQAAHHAAEAVELARSAGLPVAEATFELLGAMAAHAQGRVADAAALGARALMRARRLDLRVLTAQAALLLRQLPAGTPNVPRVLLSERDVLDLLDGQFDDRSSIGLAYGVAGECMLAGDLPTAARAAGLGMRTASAIGLPTGVDPGVMIVVALAASTGELALAARLHGALADHLEQARRSIAPGQRNMYDDIIGLVRHRLGDEAFTREMGRGAGCTRRSMLDEALLFVDVVAEQRTTPGQSATPPPASPSLTRRELEVLHLLADGISNKEIAAQLGMAPKTTMHHTSKIYRKLGVRGRGQAAAWARRSGIV